MKTWYEQIVEESNIEPKNKASDCLIAGRYTGDSLVELVLRNKDDHPSIITIDLDNMTFDI